MSNKNAIDDFISAYKPVTRDTVNAVKKREEEERYKKVFAGSPYEDFINSYVPYGQSTSSAQTVSPFENTKIPERETTGNAILDMMNAQRKNAEAAKARLNEENAVNVSKAQSEQQTALNNTTRQQAALDEMVRRVSGTTPVAPATPSPIGTNVNEANVVPVSNTTGRTTDRLDDVWNQVSGRGAFGDPTGDLAERGKTVSQTGIRWLDKTLDAINYSAERGNQALNSFMDNLNTFTAGIGSGAKASGEALKAGAKTTDIGLKLPGMPSAVNGRPVMQSSTNESGKIKSQDEIRETKGVSDVIGKGQEAYTEELEKAAQSDASGKKLAEIEKKYAATSTNPVVRALGDLDAAITGQLPYVALNAIPGVGAVLSPAMRGMANNVSAYQEARQEGANKTQARAYAGRESVNQSIGEILIGGIAGRGQGMIEKTLARTAFGRNLARAYGTFITSPLAKTAIKTVGTILGEGVEESLQEVVTNENKRATYNPNAKVSGTQILYSGILGGLTAGFFNMGDIPSTYRAYKSDFDIVNGFSKAASAVTNQEEVNQIQQQIGSVMGECIKNLGLSPFPNETDFDTRARYEYIYNGLKSIYDTLGTDSKAIIDGNTIINSAFDDAVDAIGSKRNNQTGNKPDADTINEVANVVSTVGETVSPDEDIIRATIDKVQDQIQDINAVESEISGMTEEELEEWMYNTRFKNVFPGIANAVNTPTDNMLPAGRNVQSDPSIQNPYQYSEANLHLKEYETAIINQLEARKSALEYLDSILRNQKEEVKAAVSDQIAPNENQESILPSEGKSGTIDTGNPVMQSDGKSLIPQGTNETATDGEPKYTLKHETFEHTKTKEKFDLLKTPKSLSTEDYNELKKAIRDNGGYWSGFAHGFLVPEGKFVDVQKALDALNIGVDMGETETEAPKSATPKVNETVPQFEVVSETPEIMTGERTETPQFEVAGETNIVPADENTQIQNDTETAVDETIRNEGQRTGTTDESEIPQTTTETVKPNVEKVENGKTEVNPEREEPEAESQKTDAYTELNDALKTHNEVTKDNWIFSISRNNDGSYTGEIKHAPKFTSSGVPITDARDTIARFAKPTREEVLQDIINITRNNKLLEPKEEPQERPAEEEPPKREPVAPTPKKKETVETASDDSIEPPASSDRVKPTAKTLSALKRILKASQKNSNIPNGYFDLDGWNAATDYNRFTLTDYDVSTLPQNTRARDINVALRKLYNQFKHNKDVANAIDTPSADVLKNFKSSYEKSRVYFPLTDKLFVDPDYLKDVAEAFPDAKYYVPEKTTNGIYFEAEHGRGVIMPIRINNLADHVGEINTAEQSGWTVRKHEDILKSAETENPKKEKATTPEKPVTTQATPEKEPEVKPENNKENKNNGSRESGNDTGNAGSSGTVDQELDAESGRRDEGVPSQTVQEAEETGEPDWNSDESGRKLRSDRREKSGVANGKSDSGESVRTPEPVDEGDIHAEPDESDNGKRNDRRASRSGTRSDGISGDKLNRYNYHFDNEDIRYIDSTKPNFTDNINAIKTLKTLETEEREATEEEQKVLARYKGWGGLANIFDEHNSGSYYQRKQLKELLTPEEYASARASTPNAHYTDLEVIDAIYDGLKRMGLDGGNILEPSMGTGNFFGMMPKSLSNKSALYGVEMDKLTGRIAKYLYPGASITIAPFQDARFKDGQFDAIVGNVPFMEQKFAYKGKKYSLHDFFFVKSLDHLKDGGIMMAITSTGTLDKGDAQARNAIAEKADLIAAFRLPGGMFETNAGTAVTTDLLVFRKRPEGVAQSRETFFSLGEIDGMPVNEYFVRHPNNILGELVMKKGQCASERVQVDPWYGENYKNILDKAMKTLPANVFDTDMTAGEVKVENDSKQVGFTEQDGKIYFIDQTSGEISPVSGKKADVVRDFLKLRDAYSGFLNQLNNPDASKSDVSTARKTLNTAYDGFVKKFGPLNKGGNGGVKPILKSDPDYWWVSALETEGKEKGTWEKTSFFNTDSFSRPAIEHVDSSIDALAASISERGKVDLDYMSKITGLSKEKVLESLGGRVVETPEGEYLPAELYLSGNVREKLKQAEKAARVDPRFSKNVEMLKGVVPQDVSTDNIAVNIGASWIPESYYNDFAREVLYSPNPNIKYDRIAGKWIVEKGYYPTSPQYGVDVQKLLESTMNQKMMQIRKEGKLDKKATEDIQQRQRLLRDNFAAWIFASEKRKAELGELYNERFNSWRGADYEELGKMLSFDGVSPKIDLRDYQKSAIARGVFGGNVIYAHGVGTGKTFEMIATAMESKRIGITHKNVFVVPNNKVSDFQRDILKLYPDAKIMCVEPKDFQKGNRAAMISALATRDYDIAVIGHSQFGFIPVSKETERAAIQEQLDEARAVLAADNENRQARGGKSRTVKQIEKYIQGLEDKLKNLQTKTKDQTIPFEQLGIDGLFVDEAHNFKNLPFMTSLNIPGVKGGTSQRATDMFMKANYLRDKGGKIVFATATPITNTMSEIYNMLRFVSPESLKDAGIDSFDAWASIFGEVTQALEVSPDGVHFRKKDRFAKFRNANQMIGMFRQVSDVLKTSEVVKDLPQAERITVVSPENPITKGYVIDIAERIKAMGGKASATDNMLLITSDGRAAATDLRLVADQLGMDPKDLDLPDSKINKTVENVIKEYNDSKKIKGTQLIFLNQGLGGGSNKRYPFDLYTDLIRKLIKGGIKPEEIVRIDQVKPKDQKDLFQKINNGDVRVLIGTTMRMGEGLNIQDRIVAMHEVMPTNKPSEIEQSEGRAIRHGNMNKTVRIYRYLQEGSFDSYLWQQLERKQRFINVAMSGGDVQEIDDVDEFVLSASEAKALATGNPLLLEKAELDSKFNDLSSAYRVYQSTIYSAQAKVKELPRQIEMNKAFAEERKADGETVKAHQFPKDQIEITFKGNDYTDRKSFNEAFKKFLKSGKYEVDRTYTVGSSRGMKILFVAEPSTYKLIVRGELGYEIPNVTTDGETATRIVNTLNKIENYHDDVERYESFVSRDEKRLDSAKKILTEGFPKQKEYDEVSKRLQEVNSKLAEAAGGSDFEIIDEEDEAFNGNFKTEEELLEEERNNVADAIEDDEDEKTAKQKKQEKGNRYSIGSSKGKWGNGNHDKDAEVMSISDLVDEARRTFGIPINVGRMGRVPRDVQGIYKEHSDTIRTRTYGDLPTIAHEIGHHFDERYQLHESPYIQSLVKAFGNDLEMHDYSDEQIPYESVAEYFRVYMNDRQVAETRYPKFTEWMYSKISPTDKKKLEDFSKKANAYHAADLERRASVQVHYRTEETPAQVVAEQMKRNPAEYLGSLSRDFIRNWFDDLVDLRGFGRTYDLAYYEKQARQIAHGRLTSAFTDKDGHVVGRSLADILEDGKIDDRNARTFDEYLIARRALDQFEAAERGEDVGTLVYADEELNNADSLAERIDKYERENPYFHQAAEGVYEYERNLLDLAVNSGLMSEELRDRLNELYPHYVPLYRVMDDKSKARGAKRGYADQNTPIARFKGSGRDIYSPIESIIQNTEKFTAACMRNDVMVEFANFLDENEGFGWAGERIPQKKILDFISTDELGKLLDRFAKETDKLDSMSAEAKTDLVESIMSFVGDTLSQWKPAVKQGKRVVSVMRDGQRSYYEIHDEGLYKALTNMDAPQWDIVTKFFGAVTRANKFFYTTSNPQFVFTNPQRDIVTGFVSSTTTDNPFRYIGDFARAYMDAVFNTEEYQEYVRSGGGYMGSVTSDYNLLKRVSRDVVKQNKSRLKKFLDTVAEIIPRLVDAGETASRLAEWKRALNQGDDNMEALRKAQEVTVNFARGGRVVKQINQYIPFFMAGFNAIGHNYNLFVNGGDGGGGNNGNNGFGLNLSPEGKSRRHKAWIKWFLTTGLFALLTWLFNYLISPKISGESEEEVKQNCDNLSNYNKNAFYNWYLGDGKFLRVKKTQDMSIPATIIERMAEYYILDQKDSLNDLADFTFDNILPVNPFNGDNALDGMLSILGEVSGIGTAVDLARNEDFKGSPILSSRYQYLPKEEQYTNNTSNVWIGLGRALNMSPIQLQYAAEDNFGWAARLLDNLTPYNGERSLGIKNKLVTDSVYSTDIINNFYDQKDYYDKASKAYQANPDSSKYSLEEVLGAYKYSKVADLYSDLNRFTREERDTDISREMKARTNAIIQTVNEDGITDLDRAVIDLAETTGTDITDIAPYIVTPDHISVKVDKQNVSLDMTYDDMVTYFTQAQTAFENVYGQIIQSGYDDETTAKLLVEARKAINKDLRSAWGQNLLAQKIAEIQQ